LKLNGTKIASVKSSNKKVATVSKSGKVTAKKKVTATITLTGKNGVKYKCKVTVKKATKKYDGYDQWGNGFRYSDDMDKIFDCDLPVPFLDLNQTMISPKTGNTLYGFFFYDGQRDTEAFQNAKDEAQRRFGTTINTEKLGYYNGKCVRFFYAKH